MSNECWEGDLSSLLSNAVFSPFSFNEQSGELLSPWKKLLVIVLLVEGRSCKSGEARGGKAFGLESNDSFRCMTGYDSLYPEVLDVCDTALSSSHDPSVGLALIDILNLCGSDSGCWTTDGGVSRGTCCWLTVVIGDEDGVVGKAKCSSDSNLM